jgi:MFS family permease
MRHTLGVTGSVRAVAARAGPSMAGSLTSLLGGAQRARVIVVLACVLGLSGGDVATVGASATELRHGLHISDTGIGVLLASTLVVGAVATVPFGVLADHVRRTATLAAAVALWGVAMIWCAAAPDFGMLVVARLFLGVVTAAAGPLIASLSGDYFEGSERGRVYSFLLTGELVGTGFGFLVTGDVAAISWRAAFLVLAVPAFVLAWLVVRLPEPARGRRHPLAQTPGEGPSPGATPAQRLARERGVRADGPAVAGDPRDLPLPAAVRYVLAVRTNRLLIASSALGYYFITGIQAFGSEFAKEQYGIGQAVANVLLVALGAGAVAGVLAGGAVGDALLRRGRLTGRILTAAVVSTLAPVLFAPGIFAGGVVTAIPYLVAAAFLLGAQNPPLDAARLDIMPAGLWGRAESARTLIRSLAQAAAPVAFGAASDHVFGGGRHGLEWTFGVMLVPLAASAAILWMARTSYPHDVAAAAAAAGRGPDRA